MSSEVFLSVTFPSSLGKDEVAGLVGNLENIGSWNLNKALIMKPNKTNQKVWEISFSAPRGANVQYRYFTGMVMNTAESGDQNITITSWEVHANGRSISVSKTNSCNKYDTFGLHVEEKECKIDKGWLTHQHEFRFSFSSPKNLPFLEFCDNGLNGKIRKNASTYQVLPEACATSFSSLVMVSPYKFAVKDESKKKFSVPTTNDVHYVYTLETLHPEKEFVKFQVYNENDSKVGTGVLSCRCLAKSKGTVKVPVVDEKFSVIAVLRVPYLWIQPFFSTLSMEQCYTRHWKRKPMLHVGHRGSGNSYTSEKIANVMENSVASFNQASKHGADYLEFDVHLTKDGVPIVYHDLTACISAAEKGDSTSSKLVEVPVHVLRLDELQSLKMRHRSRRTKSRELNFEENSCDVMTHSFPTLRKVLEDVPVHTGFNIEVKWPTLDEDHEYEDSLEHYIDANCFVDAILKIVFDSVKTRKVIFSCFDVDICIMLRRKQNRYPVLFLTNGDTLHYKPLLDLREASNSMAIGTAKAEGFLGIDTLDKDVYRTPEIVTKAHEAGLIFACYGDHVGDNLDKMKKAMVDIAIYDRIYENNQLVSPTV